MPGPYTTRLRQLVTNDHRKPLLEFYANGLDPLCPTHVLMNYLERAGSITACHNIAQTLLEEMGTGTLTVDEENPVDVGNLITTGGYIMEIKFARDHSVCLISSVADPRVEILEGWAGNDQAGNVTPYEFVTSVFVTELRLTKANAAAALNLASTTNNLATRSTNVGLLTRCVAGGCGIHKGDFAVTINYAPLKNIGTWYLAAQTRIQEIKDQVELSSYMQNVYTPNTVITRGLICFRCTKRLTWRFWQGYWHVCTTCREVYCDSCGDTFQRPTNRSLFGLSQLRHRQCPAGHTMDMV